MTHTAGHSRPAKVGPFLMSVNPATTTTTGRPAGQAARRPAHLPLIYNKPGAPGTRTAPPVYRRAGRPAKFGRKICLPGDPIGGVVGVHSAVITRKLGPLRDRHYFRQPKERAT